MNNPRLVTIFTSAILLTLLIGVIIWASLESNVILGLDQVFSTRWGIATIADIYIALTFIGIWIGFMENSAKKGVAWTLSLYLLGNIITLVYIMIRAGKSTSFKEIFLPKNGEKR